MTNQEVLNFIKENESKIDDYSIDKKLLEKGVTQEQLDMVNDMYCDEFFKECKK